MGSRPMAQRITRGHKRSFDVTLPLLVAMGGELMDWRPLAAITTSPVAARFLQAIAPKAFVR